jgi:hypothetical protein
MTNIIVEIETLVKWQRVALAVFCTSSLAPVVTRFAQPITQRTFTQGIEAAWNSVRVGSADSHVAALRRTLDNLSEATCDDSNVPGYEVMRAIGALAGTLDAIMDESGQPAMETCDIVTGSFSGFDHVMAYGNQARHIDPLNPPPPGRLEAMRLQGQQRAIETMRTANHVGGQLVNALQDIGNQLTVEIELVLPVYAQRRGWKL